MGLGRGVKIIEAMAGDVPVVATDVGGVRELISDFGLRECSQADRRYAERTDCTRTEGRW